MQNTINVMLLYDVDVIYDVNVMSSFKCTYKVKNLYLEPKKS